ncbi:substrate-binding domain-containing protein [Lonepinella koalarum]|uniref:Monosaccharide ABC transporter substrate-binding protein (CUT2 family) n=1 Tax=Lonepinella koalarum TaxID=53417 RepID=A0A4R1L0B5_9PAST|nr:substrate-binding domain-containing protein [Lonepinella koalarum]MDH2926073.1 ABC transporter substrate-binding protein [Lonepinella koalarum]TCK71224.1 monosaccharide ABC transporter substrate-binding protein (CUT2 family) [Lonepinella koalarum]TFJ90950.1 ABC transporter substrate-binding protein [Lonepinella koalarum]
MRKFLKTMLISTALSAVIGSSAYANLAPLNSDTEQDRVNWTELDAKFGAFPAIQSGVKIGGVSKTLTNEYWRSLGDGYKSFATKYNVFVAYQAAANEGDQLGQLSIAETMITEGYSALLFSPQTDVNLQPAAEVAQSKNIPVVNVNDAVMPTATHYVGNVQKDNGVRVAQWFIDNRPDGGKVAVVEGPPGVFAAKQRTEGFTETINKSGKFNVVASVPANWSREQAYNVATTILQRNPDLIGFYVNNDGMALGVVEAVKALNLQKQVAVFGTDGISDAYKSILAGELTGTVDSFPVLTGEVAMEVVLRLTAGQQISRVVTTPQALITQDNAKTYFNANPEELRKVLAK